MSDHNVVLCPNCKKASRVADLKEFYGENFDPDDPVCPFCLQDIRDEISDILDDVEGFKFSEELEERGRKLIEEWENEKQERNNKKF